MVLNVVVLNDIFALLVVSCILGIYLVFDLLVYYRSVDGGSVDGGSVNGGSVDGLVTRLVDVSSVNGW